MTLAICSGNENGQRLIMRILIHVTLQKEIMQWFENSLYMA